MRPESQRRVKISLLLLLCAAGLSFALLLASRDPSVARAPAASPARVEPEQPAEPSSAPGEPLAGRRSVPAGPSASESPAAAPADESETIVVQVRVEDAFGLPVAACDVFFTTGWHDERGDLRPVVRRAELSDEEGLACCAFDARKAADWLLLVWARAADGRISEELELDPIVAAGPYPLRLGPASSITLRVLELEGGRGVSGATCTLNRAGRESRADATQLTTDASGEALFDSLPTGNYGYVVEAPDSDFRRRGTLTLRRTERKLLELALSDESMALAAAGRFVDEQGRPVQDASVFVGESRTNGRVLRPNDQGRFALYRSPCERVLVHVAERATGGRFSPEQMSVPFGTTGLVFQRIQSFRLHTSRFRLVDASSEQALVGSRLYVYVHEADRMNSAQELFGVLQIEHALRPDLRWMADAPGYRRTYGRVEQSEEVLVIPMTPGSAWDLQVLDALDAHPLEGVSFRQESVVYGRSGSDGRVHIESELPPLWLSVQLAGYRDHVWRPFDPSDFIYLRAQ